MGDIRFAHAYERIRRAQDPLAALRSLPDEEIIGALAAASYQSDPYLTNVLATEAQNRARQMAAIVQSADEGLVALDLAGRVRFANPAAGRLLGQDAGAIVGSLFHDLTRHRVGGHETSWDACPVRTSVLGDGRTYRSENDWFSRADGTSFPASYSATPIRREGAVEGAVLVFRDITQRHEDELRLQESEERYRSLFAHNPDAVYSFDVDGRFLSANDALARLSGYTREELLEVSFLPLVAPEARERTVAHFQAAARGEAQTYESVLLRKDGERLRVQVTNVPIVVGGRVVGVYGVAKDVTARRLAEEHLAYQRSLLEARDEASPEATLVVDPQGRMVVYNRRFVDLWGFPERVLSSGSDEEALAHALSVVEDPEGFLRRVREVYAQRPETAHDELVFRDGRIIERHGAPVRSREDVYHGWLWSFRDVTAERRSTAIVRAREAQLSASASRLRALFDHAPMMVFLMDLDMRIESANRFGARYLGYDSAELVGRPVSMLVHAADWPRFEERLRRLATGEETTLSIEFRKVAKGGEILYVRDTLHRIADDGAKPFLVNFCTDLTEDTRRVRAERSLRRDE